MTESLQDLCALGQDYLLATDYLAAERTLARAEAKAYADADYDTLARLYMPLQEARRQRRQRCGEGIVRLDLIAKSESDRLDPETILARYPHGQLLVAGFGSIEPARTIRMLALQQGLYVETYLAASYHLGTTMVVALIPHDAVIVPEAGAYTIDTLHRALPPHSIILASNELPSGEKRGDSQTFAETMTLWERLHSPFLAMADQTTDARRRIDGYRLTIQVDYACELAHQRLSQTAHELARTIHSPATVKEQAS